VDNALLGLTEFGGVSIDENALLLKYTYHGDIDVNGEVNADDLTVFANNFGRATGATQIDGDIDFDGDVDADDLTVFANNFGKGVGAPLTAAAAPQAVVARSPDRATSSTAGLTAFDRTAEPSGPAVVRGQGTRAQRAGATAGLPSSASAADALVDLLAETFAADAIVSSSDSLADARLAASRKANIADALWADAQW
jgi:hypothetical protein